MSFRIACVGLLLVATACGPRDDRYDPSHFSVSGPVVPAEIAVPRGTHIGSFYGGLVPATTADAICCSAGPHVDVPVRKRGGETKLVVGSGGAVPSDLIATFPDGHRARMEATTGGRTLWAPLPPALRAQRGVMRIRLDTKHAPYALVSIYFD